MDEVKHLRLKAATLLVFTFLLVVGSVLYLLQARGLFEPTQSVVLVADDAEGVVVGMDMTFSGFPIGRVHSVELAESGNVHILVDVPRKDAHWLRTSSVFTLERGLVGGTTIRAFSGILTDPPLPDAAERPVLRGDATAQLQQVLTSAKATLDNLAALTGEDGAVRGTANNVRDLTERLKGPRGALGAVFGNEADAQKVVAALDRANALLAKLDTLAARTDTQVFGSTGLVQDAKSTVRELNALLADTRASLRKVDDVLTQAQGISADVHGATRDLQDLRNDVEANLHKIDGMIDQLNRRWPFTRNTEVKVP